MAAFLEERLNMGLNFILSAEVIINVFVLFAYFFCIPTYRATVIFKEISTIALLKCFTSKSIL